MTEIIGWTSSLILLLTLIKQVHKQWKDRTSEGISMAFYRADTGVGWISCLQYPGW